MTPGCPGAAGVFQEAPVCLSYPDLVFAAAAKELPEGDEASCGEQGPRPPTLHGWTACRVGGAGVRGTGTPEREETGEGDSWAVSLRT